MAIETLKLIKKAGNVFSAVDIIGKKHLCSQGVKDMDASMFNNFCSAMIKDKRCKFYRNCRKKDMDKERTGILRIFSSKGPMSTQEAMAIASAKYCTYEMLMEAAKVSDIVVGDYFHLFGMGDKFLKRAEKELKNTIIIVDEAHNLSARLRSYMSSRISTRTCDLAIKEADESEEIQEYVKQIKKVIRNLGRKYIKSTETFVRKDEFIEKISEISDYDSMIGEMTNAAKDVLSKKKISFIDRIAEFLNSWKGDDFGYARIMSRTLLRRKDHIILYYNCLDPSLISKPIINGSHSTILMSGTLSPMEMHQDLLGMDKNRTMLKSYPSPFPKENRKNIIVRGITTKYTERTSENFKRIATTVRSCVNSIRGNSAVFFSSYEIRNYIHKLTAPAISKHIILEESDMTKEERDKVKDEMEKYAARGAVLFGVMGGSFSEGIDLPGELLNGVIIVGLPLNKPDLSVKALIDYYEQRFHKGMAYGYMYPAMIKVIQSAGRCIRSESDRGVIVFADERFTWRNYYCMFPNSWEFVITSIPETEIKRFFA
jgi:DNA excision repair protein ERCC-2